MLKRVREAIFCLVAVLSLAVVAAGAARAQSARPQEGVAATINPNDDDCCAKGVVTCCTMMYPQMPIKIIVPFAAGGQTDLVARITLQRMAAGLGHPIIVENRPGASGAVGLAAVAKSKPDGYTLVLADRGTLGISPSLYSRLTYDPLKDFTYIGVMTEAPTVLVANPKLGLKSVSDLVNLAKSESIDYASPGTGTLAHLNLEAFNAKAEIKMNHIPYRGAAPTAMAIEKGAVAVSTMAPSTVIGQINAGKVTPLAITTQQRLPQLPDVPTLAEAGFEGAMVSAFYALAAPAGTPAPIVERLNKEMRAALAAPEVVEKLKAVGMLPVPSSPEEARRLVAADVERFGNIVKAAGIKAQ